ncbi:beta-lactamase family protein [Nonomuraea sp. NBC_01738]|uniref:serine hydrolase domain-containing protein n=1 Tax=Nonomuraea sp. NBC_01738 TaxID=2976003 RepID=UPI002E15F6DE|nr:beta-lactamase family protein [Nonomuraea sp. NBC_01738]
MRYSRMRALVAVAVLLVVQAPAAALASARDLPELTPAVTARLDSVIRQTLRETGVPGVIVGLSAPGKGSYVRAFGVADKATGAAMKPDLFMRIGSETKTFTVTALLQLVDQGKAGLDDPIGRYIDGVPNGDRITLRQLAGMRSGLFNYSEDPGFFKALTGDPDRPFTPEELLAFAFKHPPMFAPGAEFYYSNTNLILLGLVVEKLGELPLDEFISRHILKPEHLDRTVFPTDAAFPAPHAHGYTNQTASGDVEDSTDWNPSWGWAAGAMISDLDDLRTWARVLATGALLTPETQAQRLTMQPALGTSMKMAYGLGIFNIEGWIGHNGSLPGYGSLTIYLPESQATLVVLLNTDIAYQGQEPSTVFGRAITEVVTPDHVYDLPKPPATPSPSPS